MPGRRLLRLNQAERVVLHADGLIKRETLLVFLLSKSFTVLMGVNLMRVEPYSVVSHVGYYQLASA